MPQPQVMPLQVITRHEQNWNNCTACPLHKVARRKVFYRAHFADGSRAVPGHDKIPLLFVGEAPAHSEDSVGEPLIGPSGEVLDDVIAAMKVLTYRQRRTHVPNYAVCNVVACMSAGWDEDYLNEKLPQLKIRTPRKSECEACRPRLQEFITLLNPKWVVTLGSVARVHTLPAVAGIKCNPMVIPVKHPGTIFRKADPVQELPYYVSDTATIIVRATDVFKV